MSWDFGPSGALSAPSLIWRVPSLGKASMGCGDSGVKSQRCLPLLMWPECCYYQGMTSLSWAGWNLWGWSLHSRAGGD